MKPPVKFLNTDMAPNGDITQWFGENPQLYARFGINGHNGVDIVRPHGDPLYAIESGTVVSVKNDPHGFGKHLRFISKETDSKGYRREWTYGHNSKNYVKVGDVVFTGQHIADIGNTGFVVSNSTGNGFWKINPFAGTHLHLGLRLVREHKNGWSYEGSPIKLDVINYQNGYKGAIDPRPFLEKIKSTAPKENRSIFQQLLRLKDIINRFK